MRISGNRNSPFPSGNMTSRNTTSKTPELALLKPVFKSWAQLTSFPSLLTMSDRVEHISRSSSMIRILAIFSIDY